MRQVIFYTAALVAVYLVVSRATGAGRVLQSAGSVYTGAVRTLQGR